MTIQGTISSIWSYPVKSMVGTRVESAQLTERGIEGDRRLALRDLETGKILSAKVPSVGRRLLALEPSIGNAGIVSIDIDGTVHSSADPDALDAALSALLGRSVELTSDTRDGDVYASEWPEIDGLALSGIELDLPIAMSTAPGTFVDLAGLHIVADSTIAALDRSLPDTVIDTRRFRPSFTVDVDGGGDFAENDWVDATATVGDAVIRFGAVSPRCVMTTLEQPGLPSAKEILRTLAATNRHDFQGVGDFACLGIYAEVVTPGTIDVGQQIVISPPG